MLSPRLAGLLATCILFPAFAAGQELGPPEGMGAIRGFVFRANGLPVEGVQVRVFGGPRIAETNAEGMFATDLETGEYNLEFVIPGRADVLSTTRPIPVLEGQETEFILTLPQDGEPFFDVEVPEEAIETEAVDEGVTGTVEGIVTSAENGDPVEGARVFVRGTPNDARTGPDGRFSIELPVGNRELTVIHPNFSTTTIEDVLVERGQITSIDTAMEKKTFQLAEIVITTPRIEGSAIQVLQRRQDSSNVADVLGADQISKAGDSDAASALSRVTGVTIVGGKFVYVRGLGERYSQTTLNGSSLPSPDPERRVVPLDIFPASTIAALTVQKTYSPDIPGEFGGGIVQIETKDIPEEFEASIGVSGNYIFGTTFADGLTYPGSNSDFLGFGAGQRALPNEFQEIAETQLIRQASRFEEGLSTNDLERLGEQLDPVFGPSPYDIPPGFGISASLGGKFDLFGVRSGASIAADYSNSYFLKDSTFNQFRTNEDGTLAARRTLDILETQNDIGLTGLASIGFDFDDENSLRLTSGVFRSSINRTQSAFGFDADIDNDIQVNLLRWSERMVNTNQIRGTNLLVDAIGLRLEWRYQFALATRDEPNRRFLRYSQRGNELLLDNDGNERYYSDLLDLNHEVGVDFSIPAKIFGDIESKLATGFALDVRSRDVDTRRYFFQRRGTTEESASLRSLPANRVFRDDTIQPDLFQLQETTRNDDNYVGNQYQYAGYLMGDFGLLKNLSILAGARVESSLQTIEIRGIGDREPDQDGSRLQRLDVMPAVTATWEFIENMQLRLAGALTVNRPNFRELSPAAFIDFARGQEARGNPELDRAQIYHADLRWEWYPSPGESVSVAAFGKIIENPIEYTLSGGANQILTPINTEEAVNFGAEIEFRKNFGFVSDFLADLYMAGNLTLVSSRITIGEGNVGILTSSERALQGQSPYAINAQVGYDNADAGFSGTVLFNVFGPRISEVGTLGLPDVFEEPRPQLDVVLKQRIESVQLGLKFQNILNPDTLFTQTETGDEGVTRDRERFSRGLRISASLTVDF